MTKQFLLMAMAVPLAACAMAVAQGTAHYPTPDQPPGTPRLEYDVVSIKPAPPEQRGGGVRPMPGYQGYIGENVTLFSLLQVAYGVTREQIIGGPGWIESDRWSVEAKSERPRTFDELHIMLEHALEDRFAIKLHHQVQNGDVLILEVDPRGARLQSHEPANDLQMAPIRLGAGSQPGTMALAGSNVSLSNLAYMMSRMQSTPVVDHTGLDGRYDISIEFPAPPDEGLTDRGTPKPPDISALFESDVLKKQLGLRLVQGRKAPIDHIVIDSAQKLVAN